MKREKRVCVLVGVVVVGHHPSFFFFLSILLFFIYFPCVPLNFLLFFLTRRRGDSPCKRLFTWHPNLFFSTSFFFFGSSLEQTKHEKATQRESKTCARAWLDLSVLVILDGHPPPTRNQGLIHTNTKEDGACWTYKKCKSLHNVMMRVWLVIVRRITSRGRNTSCWAGFNHP